MYSISHKFDLEMEQFPEVGFLISYFQFWKRLCVLKSNQILPSKLLGKHKLIKNVNVASEMKCKFKALKL